MAKINFTELVLVNIEGKEYEDTEKYYKVIGEIVRTEAKSIELSDIWKKIWNGEEVELWSEQIRIIKENIEKYINSPAVKPNLFLQICKFIDSK